jgi:Ca2+-binding EF-hand superfamily protein
VSKEKFDEIDTDHDGFITASELKASITDASGVSQEHIDAIVAMADEDGDQRISHEEYEKLLG